jgi:hypothetical protein
MGEHTRDDAARSRADERGGPAPSTPIDPVDGPATSLPPDSSSGAAAPDGPLDPAEPLPPLAHDDWRPLAGGPGLVVWLVILLVLGGGGLVGGEEEMAGLVAIAGLFAAAQAADLDPRWRGLYRLLAWVVPAGGVLLFGGFAGLVQDSTMLGARRAAAFSVAIAGAVMSFALFAPQVSRALAGGLFRTRETTHTMRLAARLIALGFGLSIAGVFAADALLGTLLEGSEPLLARVSPVGQTVGAVALALAGVGYLVRRDLPATLARLGVGRVTPGHVAVIALGVIALIGFNAGADRIQHWLLPELWERDRRVNEALALGITVPQALMIGITAGVGEEITLRGGLQPRLGLFLTSLLFAGLHVQYSWFGMAVILGFGMILGVIRARTNTTVVMAVHTVYDVIVLLMVT